MFKIGDKISHPVHGAGVIQDIETKEILGEEMSFYTIDIPLNKMKLMVSTDKADEIGIRKVLDKSQMKSILVKLTTPIEEKTTNWMERSRVNTEKIRKGKIEDVAEVVKELYALDKQKGLSATEKRTYNSAKQILISELSLVNNVNNEQAELLMKDALNKNVELM